MDDLFKRLESRIRTLLQDYDGLKELNHELRQSKVALSQEKKALLEKQRSIILQIENMVSRLKSIEGVS